MLKSTAQARIERARERDKNSGISAILARSRPRVIWGAEVRPPIAAYCGIVTSFQRPRIGPKVRQFRANSALAGDCDIFVAMAMRAVRAGCRVTAGNFVGSSPPI